MPSTLDPRPSTPITITCPGFARHEKGSDLLQEAIRRILKKSGRQDSEVNSQESGGEQLATSVSPSGREVRFVLQWPESFAMPDGSMLGPDPELVNDPRVEFLNDNLSQDEYEALLARTDLVILPYRRNSYHNRVSRVAIEAASRGIPLIFTSGTWIGEVTDTAGGGVPILDETPEAVAEAITIAIIQLDELKAKASTSAGNVSRFYSVETFCDGLAVA
jgi:glycosyltransferase involved in cell wall biosynthesis